MSPTEREWGDTSAVGEPNPDGSYDYGLFQIRSTLILSSNLRPASRVRNPNIQKTLKRKAATISIYLTMTERGRGDVGM